MLKKLLLSLLFTVTLLNATVPTEKSVTKLYIATFDRAPDKAGLEYWLHNSGLHLEGIAKSFFDQKETKTKYPSGFSDSDFIQKIYKNLFKRDADSAGFEYWHGELKSGKVQRSVFILATINGALGNDAKILTNKTTVGLAFERDGRKDVAEAKQIMVDVTALITSVSPVLCKYKLSGCIAENQAPVAIPKSITVDENSTNNTITLRVLDTNKDTLTYTIKTKPTNGTLSGTPPNLTYSPNTNYSGADSFTFIANDGKVDSNSAKITITIKDTSIPNTTPIALPQTIEVDESSTNNTITLTATDKDSKDTLTYTIKTQPTNGSLSGTPPNLTYTPTANYTGIDSFTFVANDGKVDSSSAIISITVTSTNNAPTASTQTITVDEDTTANSITLAGADGDNDTLSYSIVDNPTNGTLTIAQNIVKYTPTANYAGDDSFTFKVNDGEIDSSKATVSIGITNINDAPVITSSAITIATEDVEYTYTPTIEDVESDTISWSIVSQPLQMSIDSSTGELSWTPTEGVTTTQEMTLKATDSGTPNKETTQKFTITVTAVNDKPTATPQDVEVDEDSSVGITLTGEDAEGSSLNYTIVDSPQNGTLASTPPNLIYAPNANYAGDDSFTFTVNDGELDSLTATVSITVTDVNEKPIANAGANQDDIEAGEVVSLDGSQSSDADANDVLTYLWSITSKPTNSVAELSSTTAQSPTFIADKVGSYLLSLIVNDGSEDSNMESTTITTINASTLSTLKKTMQIEVYNPRDDGDYQIGITHSYTRNADDTVTDGVTGLVWQDNESIEKEWVTQANYDAGNYSDTSGDTATTYCTELALGGFDDWRLPTRLELKGIVDRSKTDPSIDEIYFQNTSSNLYWSSTTVASNSYGAWVVYFNYGRDYWTDKDNSLFVRCVRGGQ